MALDLYNLTEQRIDDNLDNYSMTLFGQDGSGKSSLMYAIRRKLGSTVIFGYEDRFKGIPKIRVVEHTKWKGITKKEEEANKTGGKHWGHLDTIKQLRKDINAGKGLPFKNIIIDTVGKAYVMCQDAVMEDNEWETMSGDRGARYPVVGKTFMDSVYELRSMGFIVNFVAHDKVISGDDNEVDKISPDAANQIKHLVMGGIDIIAYLEKIVDEEGNEVRRLWLSGHPSYKLKTPLYGFPKYIEYETVEEGANKFIEAFNKAVKITQEMADEGQDISNPNSENEKIVEVAEVKIPTVEEDDELETDELPEEFNLESLRAKAIEVRDELRKDKDDSEVKAILRKELGTVKIKSYEDVDKLKAFIEKYE